MTKDFRELTLAVEELRSQILPYCQDNPRFQAVDERLAEISDITRAGKSSLQLVSQNHTFNENVAKFLQSYPVLAEYFDCFIDKRPKTWSLNQSKFKTTLRRTGSKNNFLELNPSKTHSIGRAEGCDIPVEDRYLLVSGHHAHLRFDENCQRWLIKDTSRNGTFVNGEKLHLDQDHELNSGDQIILGSEQPDQDSLTLFFDDPLGKDAGIKVNSAFVDIDAVCFLFDLNQELTEIEKSQIAVFKQLPKMEIFGLIKITEDDFSGLKSTQINSLLRETKKKIDISSSNLGCLNVGAQSAQLNDLNCLDDDPEFQKFMKRLQARLQERSETLLRQRLEPQINFIRSTIQILIENEQNFSVFQLSGQVLAQKKQQEENQLRLQAKQSAELVKSQKDIFWGQVEGYLEQSEKIFLDELYANSFPCKIQAFSQQLKPYVDKRRNKKILQLQYTSSFQRESDGNSNGEKFPRIIDANLAMLNFCEYELYAWVQRLWQEICSNLAYGGIKNLYDQIFQSLTPLSCDTGLVNPETYEFLTLEIAVTCRSDHPFTQVPTEIIIKEPSAFAYLMKKVRSQWMQFIFLFSFFSILGIAGRRQIMRNIMAPVIGLFNKAPILSSLVLICLLVFAVRFGLKVYREDLEEERNKQANELRGKLCKHYQELVKKHLIKTFVRDLRVAIEGEKKRIEALQTYLERLSEG